MDKQIKPLKDTFQFLALGSRSCITQDPDNVAKVWVWIGLITRLRCGLDWAYLRLRFTLSRFFPFFLFYQKLDSRGGQTCQWVPCTVHGTH